MIVVTEAGIVKVVIFEFSNIDSSITVILFGRFTVVIFESLNIAAPYDVTVFGIVTDVKFEQLNAKSFILTTSLGTVKSPVFPSGQQNNVCSKPIKTPSELESATFLSSTSIAFNFVHESNQRPIDFISFDIVKFVNSVAFLNAFESTEVTV